MEKDTDREERQSDFKIRIKEIRAREREREGGRKQQIYL